jgi:hypothetical protein
MQAINSSKERALRGKKRYHAPTLERHPVLEARNEALKLRGLNSEFYQGVQVRPFFTYSSKN